jgi:cytochrome c-type biogenesis protein CcmF
MGIPIGITLLFLMAVAPVLPWRKASTELLSQRLFWPAWCGVGAMGLAVVTGAGGLSPLIAFGLGGFAAGAAGRQLMLATRRQGLRGLIGRANGGMIVHLGVIFIAVALVASNSYSRTQHFVLDAGQSVNFAGHTYRYTGAEKFDTAVRFGTQVFVQVDDGDALAPSVATYKGRGQPAGKPSVRTGPWRDIYITLDKPVPKTSADPAGITISIKSMMIWMWIGGALMGLGTVFSAFPGRRRRPTDATSAPIPPMREVGAASRGSNLTHSVMAEVVGDV